MTLTADVAGVPDGELAPYPLVTVAPRAGEVCQYASSQPAGPVTRVRLRRLAVEEPEKAVLPRLLEAAKNGACVAWVRNTVREAQVAFNAARDLGVDVAVDLFHARMRAKDRRFRETAVLADYGAERAAGGRLLIATQVVEQSLDLNFDLLATDLAPVDLVLQRTGRLHRHPRTDRPSACRESSR